MPIAAKGNNLFIPYFYVSVSSCLKPSVQRNVNLLSVYNDEKPVSGFRKEAVTLSRSACEGSGSKDNDE